jgi:hypothetical protein
MPTPKTSPPEAPSVAKDSMPLRLADSRESTLLLLWTVELRNESRKAKGLKAMTRTQLTVPMLKRLWNRPRLAPEFIREVTDWLLIGGWTFFDCGKFYAMVRVSAVENWPRLSTKAVRSKLGDVKKGKFPFSDYEHLLWREETFVGDTESGEDADDKTLNDNE